MLIMQSEAIDQLKAHMKALCDEIKVELKELKAEIMLLKEESAKAEEKKQAKATRRK